MKATYTLTYRFKDGTERQVGIDSVPALGIWLDKVFRLSTADAGRWYIPAAQFICIERVVK